jgi:TRAP-type C4-dicarboxylate transport system permease small subunit
MKDKKSLLWKLLNKFEVYLSAWIFIAMTILLFVQVVTRYVFNHAITWTEEISCILFVWLVYLGVAAAVLSRKHLKMDIVVNALPFKYKRIVLIFGNIVSIVCFVLLVEPLFKLVQTFMMIHATTDLLKIPKAVSYGVVPVCLILSCIRYVQESIILMKETEKELGVSEPSINIAALEEEARRNGYLKDKPAKGGNSK